MRITSNSVIYLHYCYFYWTIRDTNKYKNLLNLNKILSPIIMSIKRLKKYITITK